MAKKRYPGKTDATFVKTLVTKNGAQDYYLTVLKESIVTFGKGPAGTGKTYIATHVGLEALANGEVDKVILTRPIVAVEDIGYLPGDMNEKIHPYMLPLFDAVEAHVGVTKAKEMLTDGRIEVLPLAYMRGRSLNRAYIILDEAQNTTKEQMKMFLTRLGYESRMAINGDTTQCDLPKHIESGFGWALDKLTGRDRTIGTVEFSRQNIVRNPLIETMLQFLDGPANNDANTHSSLPKIVRGSGYPALTRSPAIG
jgi:phosphate starvation-inducible PhoH-like protein